MSLKETNEITVKINATKQQLISLLLSKGFLLKTEQYLQDLYFVPSKIDIDNACVRDILSYAILIRNLCEMDKVTSKNIKLCHKNKQFDDNGSIISQTAYNLEIKSCKDAENFLTSIGYIKILDISEYEYQFVKDELMFEVKEVVGGDLLMEVETTNGKFNNVQKIISYLNKLNLPIDNTNFFIKKAEIELQKRLHIRKL